MADASRERGESGELSGRVACALGEASTRRGDPSIGPGLLEVRLLVTTSLSRSGVCACRILTLGLSAAEGAGCVRDGIATYSDDDVDSEVPGAVSVNCDCVLPLLCVADSVGDGGAAALELSVSGFNEAEEVRGDEANTAATEEEEASERVVGEPSRRGLRGLMVAARSRSVSGARAGVKSWLAAPIFSVCTTRSRMQLSNSS